MFYYLYIPASVKAEQQKVKNATENIELMQKA